MAIKDFFDHKCDLYHMVRNEKSPGFSLPASPSFSYGPVPDLTEIPCHFGGKAATISIVQSKPNANYEARIKLSLPVGTDIRLHDKVVDRGTKYEYTAEIPRNIRGHHIAVYLKRDERQMPL